MNTKTNLDAMNEARQKEFDDLIKKGELGTMTECAMGQAIGDCALGDKKTKLNSDK